MEIYKHLFYGSIQITYPPEHRPQNFSHILQAAGYHHLKIYFSPDPPEGYENNWLHTIPGKSWFVALRMYGPLEPWIEKSWRPGEFEMMDE